jgi:hypothetical protein
MHARAELAAISDEYLPISQVLHAADPCIILYLPDSHVMHGPPSDPEWPALQMHIELPATETADGGHDRHAEAASEPRVAEYLPVSHSTQAAAPTVSKYVPAGQSLQAVDSALSLYVPAEQLLQAVAPANSEY